MPWTNYALDTFFGHKLSELTVCGAEEVPEFGSYLPAFLLSGVLRVTYEPKFRSYTPGEEVWKQLKTDTVGRMVVISRDDFKRKVRSSLRQLQNHPWKIISFFQKPSFTYAA